MDKNREKLIEVISGSGILCEICGESTMSYCAEALADHLLANGATFATDTNDGGKWISVEDEKPKRRGHYFIAYKFAGSDMRFYGEAFWHDDIPNNGYVQGNHFSNEGVDGMYVTHWMEIQKLPVMQEVPNGTDHV